MPSLIDLVTTILPDENDEVEDIFSSAPGLLYPDDTRVMHGDPDAIIIYKHRRFGNIELRTADPDSEQERQLFSHYLWNSGILMAEMISNGGEWSVEGKKVLELGAGVGLAGIVATLSGAVEVVISDYPAPLVLDNIKRNAASAIPKQLPQIWSVQGHMWGDLESTLAKEYAGHFDRIIAADCLWMGHQHLNLVRSMLHFLTASSWGRVFIVAGFHTGREKLVDFFDVAKRESLEVAEIFEQDVEGVRREWRKHVDAGKENLTTEKRWVVVAKLKRRQARP